MNEKEQETFGLLSLTVPCRQGVVTQLEHKPKGIFTLIPYQ